MACAWLSMNESSPNTLPRHCGGVLFCDRADALVLRQLQRQIGDFNPEVRSQIEALPLEQLENLGEALLDFSSGTDLNDWLQSNI